MSLSRVVRNNSIKHQPAPECIRDAAHRSVSALLSALGDPDTDVLESVIFALGHRADSRAIEALLPFVDNPAADIRCAVVHGLMPHDSPNVVAAWDSR